MRDSSYEYEEITSMRETFHGDMAKGYVYILLCCDMSYYVGSTTDLEKRFVEHLLGEGSNYTRKRLPVRLIYFEVFDRIDEAFYREKQIQGWSRKKKEALIKRMPNELRRLAQCMNESHYRNYKVVRETQ